MTPIKVLIYTCLSRTVVSMISDLYNYKYTFLFSTAQTRIFSMYNKQFLYSLSSSVQSTVHTAMIPPTVSQHTVQLLIKTCGCSAGDLGLAISRAKRYSILIYRRGLKLTFIVNFDVSISILHFFIQLWLKSIQLLFNQKLNFFIHNDIEIDYKGQFLPSPEKSS